MTWTLSLYACVYVISNRMSEVEEGSMFCGLGPISSTGPNLLHCELNGALPPLFVAVIIARVCFQSLHHMEVLRVSMFLECVIFHLHCLALSIVRTYVCPQFLL